MPNQKTTVLQLHAQDNVAIALSDFSSGHTTPVPPITAFDDIPAGHKVACRNIERGAPIIKYGQVIGRATCAIDTGRHVHCHNMAMHARSDRIDAGDATDAIRPATDFTPMTFQGYERKSGSVGTRNYIGVLATVSCSSSVTHFIAQAVGDALLSQYANVDGIVALGHGSGCCLAPGSDGLEILQRTIAGYARNPNFGGILLVGLGCEVNLVENLADATGLTINPHLNMLTIQQEGGTRSTIAAGVSALEAMLPKVNAVQRTAVPLDRLVVGLECGGSDAYSGITANPSLGLAVDLLVRHGATAILSETPEIYGAEHLLTRRAKSPSVAEKLMARIHWWERYTARHDAQMDNNPTPGNKAGGISTILEKSLGAVAKAGSTRLNAVYGYAEPVTETGLVFMDTPGYDVVSITGMIAGGANLVCFTTGRGTVCGFRPVPTLKLASNSAMYERLAEDMDINCGAILDGASTLAQMGETIFETIVATASGMPTKSEGFEFGSSEFVPWPMGAIL